MLSRKNFSTLKEKRKNQLADSDESKPKRQKLVNFSSDCLDFIHNGVEENLETRFTNVGTRKNMVFTLMGNENKLMKTLLHGHGFTQGSPDNRLFNVAWTCSFMSGHKMRTLKPWQRLNMFPRIKQLTFKDELYTNIARSIQLFGDAYKFIPESFVVPRDLFKLEAAIQKSDPMKPVQYIVKPTHSSEGKGIFFITKTEHLLKEKKKLVVSRYIEKPLLVNGHKFDLRIYAAVTSIYPLVLYLYSEGLTRFASAQYCEEIEEETASYVHLTNYSLNKKSESYVRNESLSAEDHGHKWTLGALLRYLEGLGHDSKLLMMRIEDLVVKTFLSVQSSIATVTRNNLHHVGTNFHLFGFDILLDQQLKPWLLEVNLNPSLATEAPLDVLLKPKMIADLLNLICIPQIDPSTCTEEKTKVSGKKAALKRRADGSQISRFLTDSSIEKRIQQYKSRILLEQERCGDFVRIFPRENSFNLYREIMDVCGPESYDQQIYKALFESSTVDSSVTAAFHNFMGSCDERTSKLSQCPSSIKRLISSWYQTAKLYSIKITKDGVNYPANLPVVRKTARLRTESYSCYLRKKRETTTSIDLNTLTGKENTKPGNNINPFNFTTVTTAW